VNRSFRPLRPVPSPRWRPPPVASLSYRINDRFRRVRIGRSAILFGIGACAMAGVLLAEGRLVGCDIKGNVSLATGERIYHAPGQEYYEATRIRRSRGERWFCSEEEAIEAGWRRSRV
jgi:hypothetical protein